MMISEDKQRGFTLVELLAALSLLSIVSFLIISLIVFGSRQYNEQSERLKRNNEIRDAMSLVVSDLREAQAPHNIGEDGEVPISYDPDSGILIAGDQQYRQEGTNLYRNESQQLTSYLADGGFVIIPPESGEEKITVQISGYSLYGDDGKELETTIYYRGSQ